MAISTFSCRVNHRVYRPLYGVHYIMMVKSAQAGMSGGCTSTPFHYIYHHVQSCGVRSSWDVGWPNRIVINALNVVANEKYFIFYFGRHLETNTFPFLWIWYIDRSIVTESTMSIPFKPFLFSLSLCNPSLSFWSDWLLLREPMKQRSRGTASTSLLLC